MALPRDLTLKVLTGLASRNDRATVQARQTAVRELLLARSPAITEPNFTRIAQQDLEVLFSAYDGEFFAGLLGAALEARGAELVFRLAPRMVKSGGTLGKGVGRDGKESYLLSIAPSVLFASFSRGHTTAVVNGVTCHDRLDALQRIVEHEMVHLAEFLACGKSGHGKTFRAVVRGLFLHTDHRHQLSTIEDRAREVLGIRPGTPVEFDHDGRRLVGRVQRVTKRATVLVESRQGVRYSNGKRYETFYVPLATLRPYGPNRLPDPPRASKPPAVAAPPGLGEPHQARLL